MPCSNFYSIETPQSLQHNFGLLKGYVSFLVWQHICQLTLKHYCCSVASLAGIYCHLEHLCTCQCLDLYNLEETVIQQQTGEHVLIRLLAQLLAPILELFQFNTTLV